MIVTEVVGRRSRVGAFRFDGERMMPKRSYVLGGRVGVCETHGILRYTWPDPSLLSARPGAPCRTVSDRVGPCWHRAGPCRAKVDRVAVSA